MNGFWHFVCFGVGSPPRITKPFGAGGLPIHGYIQIKGSIEVYCIKKKNQGAICIFKYDAKHSLPKKHYIYLKSMKLVFSDKFDKMENYWTMKLYVE